MSPKNLKIYDFHLHTLFSDGELVPAELIRRAKVMNYAVVGLADHVDFSNIEFVLKNQKKIIDEFDDADDANGNIRPILGVELTHIPPNKIEKIAKEAKRLGAEVVVVHGETLVEPVASKTNFSAVSCEYVDILAHPGLITKEEAVIARKNDVYLEISTRRGHSLTNGHVSSIAKETGADLILNTDAHSPRDLITSEFAYNVLLGAGLTEKDAIEIIQDNPKEFMKRLDKR